MSPPLPRILLIEPQFVLRRTIAMVARDLGVVDFEEASSVGRARTLLASETYAGMVLDLSEGPQALALLDDLRRGGFTTPVNVPVILLATGEIPHGAAHQKTLEGARVLNKPVRISELLSAIAEEQKQDRA